MVRATASATGPAVYGMLESTHPFDEAELNSVFPICQRLSETDGHASNGVAERIVESKRGEHTSWMPTLRCLCSAHHVHSCAEKTWALLPGSHDPGTMHALKKIMIAEIPAWFVMQPHMLAADAAAAAHRNHIMELFSPELSAPRKRAKFELLCSVLNGCWEEPGVLQHICNGCCKSYAHALEKVLTLLPQTQVSFFGLGGSIHGFLGHCLRLFFQRDGMAKPQCYEPAAAIEEDVAVTEADRLRQMLLRAKCSALEWVTSDWLPDVLLMRSSLAGEISSMRKLLDSNSVDWELKMFHKRLSEPDGAAEYRLLHWMGEASFLRPLLTTPFEQLAERPFTAMLGNTEADHSKIFRVVLRPAAVAWQLLGTRWQNYPWTIFRLINDKSEAFATTLLNTKPCRLDKWSTAFLQRFDTVEALIGREAHEFLSAVALRLMTSTFSVERTHSRNLRSLKNRVHSQKPDLAWLSLPLSAFAGPAWLKEETLVQRKAQGQRGRPRNETYGKSVMYEEGKVQRGMKRKQFGGGGAYRAFVHVKAKGRKLDAKLCHELAVAYKNLGPEEKEQYTELGKHGLPFAVCVLVASLRQTPKCTSSRTLP
eukprot:6459781-Amphidinium_carterae.2